MLDIEKLLREGKTLEEIANLVSIELTDAQTKIDEEKEKAKVEAEKKEKIYAAREQAVAAFSTYLSLVSGEEIKEEIVRAALEDIEMSFDIFKDLKISRKGHPADILSLFFK